MALYVWVEPHFSLTPWYLDFQRGLKNALSRKKLRAKTQILEAPADIEDEKGMILLVGETYGWYNAMLRFLDRSSLQTCVVSCEMQATGGTSSITTDHGRDMANLVHFMCDAGRSRIALFGFNPSSPQDRQRIDGFHFLNRSDGFVPDEGDLYFTRGDVAECANRLMRGIEGYNAVIAGNDLYAIYLMSQLKDRGIRIPEDVYLASFGNTILSEISRPTLSSMSVNLYQMGQMAVSAYTTWLKNSYVSKCIYHLESTFYSRESTGGLPMARTHRAHYALEKETWDITSYSDKSLLKFVRLENFISKADETDLAIVRTLLEGSSIDALAEKLYLSESALDYRMSKMYRHFEVNSRQNLIQLLEEYATQIRFPEAPRM